MVIRPLLSVRLRVAVLSQKRPFVNHQEHCLLYSPIVTQTCIRILLTNKVSHLDFVVVL